MIGFVHGYNNYALGRSARNGRNQCRSINRLRMHVIIFYYQLTLKLLTNCKRDNDTRASHPETCITNNTNYLPMLNSVPSVL